VAKVLKLYLKSIVHERHTISNLVVFTFVSPTEAVNFVGALSPTLVVPNSIWAIVHQGAGGAVLEVPLAPEAGATALIRAIGLPRDNLGLLAATTSSDVCRFTSIFSKGANTVE
jgi:hypothetical protein